MKKLTFGIFIFVSVIVFALSCGSNNDDNTTETSSYSYGGTQAPGDYWEWDIIWDTQTSGTFTATNYGTSAGAVASATYSGANTILDSKFTKFTITSTTDTSVTIGSAFYGVEIPGTAILIQTAGDSPEFISCSVIGTAPTSAVTYNWTRVPDTTTMNNHSTTSGVMAYGTSAISHISGSTYQSVDTTYDWEKNEIGSATTSSLILSDNKLYSPNVENPTSITVLAPSGCFMCDMGSDGGVFGSIAPSTNVDISDFIEHDFRGYCVMYNSSSEINIFPIYCKPSETANRMTSAGYTDNDVENGTEDANKECEVKFESATQPTPGLVFNISSDGGVGFEESIVTAITKIDGKYVFSGFGRVKTDAGAPYVWENFVMVQVD